MLQLLGDLSFQDLYSIKGIKKLDNYFLEHLNNHSSDLYDRLVSARKLPSNESELILQIAPILQTFLSNLFHITIPHKLESLSLIKNAIAISYKRLLQKNHSKTYLLMTL